MTRLRAKNGFSYPADAESLATIRQHGGLRRLPAGVTVRYKTVKPGEWCDDMPAESAAIYLERGEVEQVPVAEPKRTAKKGAA